MGCMKNGNKRQETIIQYIQQTFLAILRGKTVMNISSGFIGHYNQWLKTMPRRDVESSSQPKHRGAQHRLMVHTFTSSHYIGSIYFLFPENFHYLHICYIGSIQNYSRVYAFCPVLSKIVSQTDAEMRPSSEYGILPMMCLRLLSSTGKIISF